MRKQITIITIAVFSISILLSQSFIVNPAYAQTFQVISNFAQPIKAMHYQPETDSIWVLSEGSGFTWLYQVSRTSKSIIFSHNHTKTFDDLSAGVTQDIWCGKTECFITSATGSSGLLVRIPTIDIAPNIFKGKNVTGTVANPSLGGFWHLTGRDQVNGGFGSVTLWVDGCSEGGATCDGALRTIDGISMQIVNTFAVYANQNLADHHVHDLQWSGIAGITDNTLVTFTGQTTETGAVEKLRLWDLTQSPPVETCETFLPTNNNAYDLANNYAGGGSPDNKIYLGSINGIMYVYNDSCTLLQTISASDTGLSGEIRFIEYDGGRIFMQEDGANARLSQMLVNSTGHVITTGEPTVYFPLPSSAQTIFDSAFPTVTLDNMILLSGNGQLWFPYTGTDKKIGILTYSAASSPTQVCIDTNLDGVTDLCFEDTNNDGVPDNGQLGALGAYRSNANLTSFGSDVFCAFGINMKACTDKNIKTNGVGLTLLALLILISYAFLVSVHIFAQQRLSNQGVVLVQAINIHPLLLTVMLIIDVGTAWTLSWIDNTIFYTMIAVMVGFASFGLYRVIRGGNE